MRHVHLEPVGAMVQLFARGLTGFDGAVDDLHAFGNGDFGRIAFEVVAAGGGNTSGYDKHTRAGNDAFVDCLFNADVAVTSAFGFDITNRGEALFECAMRGNNGARGAVSKRMLEQLRVISTLGRIFALQKDVSVRVNEAGEHGGTRKIDHVRTGGNLGGGGVGNGLDLVSSNND